MARARSTQWGWAALLCVGCASPGEAGTPGVSGEAARPSAPRTVAQDPASPPSEVGQEAVPPTSYALSEVTIRLERTQCEGMCPAYEVAVGGTGAVTYNGVAFVEAEGPRERVVATERVAALLRDFYSVDFFSLSSRYEGAVQIAVSADGTVTAFREQIMDLPGRVITIEIGDYRKQVTDVYGGPPALRELAQTIDEVAGTAEWVGGAPPTGDG